MSNILRAYRLIEQGLRELEKVNNPIKDEAQAKIKQAKDILEDIIW